MKNTKIISFNDFKLNEDGEGGGTAGATLGNISGMGNVSAPPVSTNGSINNYTGDGSPTETVGRGSGDLPAYSKPFDKSKKKKKTSSTDYVVTFKDWMKNDVNN